MRPSLWRGLLERSNTLQLPDPGPTLELVVWPTGLGAPGAGSEPVTQDASITPPSTLKLTAVPSGTGLPKWSPRVAVTVLQAWSISRPSQLPVLVASEKCFWSGMPVDTTSVSDSVVIGGEVPRSVATTRTDVGIVPAVTSVVTVPPAADVAKRGFSVRPPTVSARPLSEKAKSTSVPCTGAPVVSETSNLRVENSWRPKPPVPCSAMLVVAAETNLIEPAVAGSTMRVPVRVEVTSPKVTDAVITSGTPHPLSE